MAKNQSNRRSRKEVSEILTSFQKSGQTPTEFCSQRNINIGTFQWWQNRERKMKPNRSDTSSSFIRLSLPPQHHRDEYALDIEYSNGNRVKVRINSDLSSLRELLAYIGEVAS